jgi:hypothetical protein
MVNVDLGTAYLPCCCLTLYKEYCNESCIFCKSLLLKISASFYDRIINGGRANVRGYVRSSSKLFICFFLGLVPLLNLQAIVLTGPRCCSHTFTTSDVNTATPRATSTKTSSDYIFVTVLFAQSTLWPVARKYHLNIPYSMPKASQCIWQ